MQLFRVSDSCIYKYALSSGALSRNCHLLPHCQHRRGYASFADSQPPALITRLNSLCGARGQSKPLAFPLPDPVATEPCLRGCVPIPVLATSPLPLPCPLGWWSGRGELVALLGALSPAESLLVPRRSWGILCGSCAAGVLCSFQDLGQGVASMVSVLPCLESVWHCPSPLPRHRAQSRVPCPFSRHLPPRDTARVLPERRDPGEGIVGAGTPGVSRSLLSSLCGSTNSDKLCTKPVSLSSFIPV